MKFAIEVSGWTGTVLMLLAYLLASRGYWPAASWRGAAVNLVGGMLLIVNVWYHHAYPLVGLNLAWTSISVSTLLRCARRDRSRGNEEEPNSQAADSGRT